MNIAVFLSGTGSNFLSIARAAQDGKINVRIVLVISNREEAKGLRHAEGMGIPTTVFDRSKWADGNAFGQEMLKTLNSFNVEFIVLAGYLKKIPPLVIRAFSKKIVNIHPALLPEFGGKGMFGMNVHRAVIEAGEAETGVTIHYVDEIYDNGEIIDQRRVAVLKNDSPESLAARVLKVEHEFYPEVLGRLAEQFHGLKPQN